MEISRFLKTVITSDEGWFCLAIGKSGGVNWFEQFYRWPAQHDEILERIDSYRAEHNVYFSAHLFSVASSAKVGVMPTRTIQADLDDASLDDLPLPPTVLVNTSPGRHQAYWVLREALPVEQHELLSRRLTYSIPKCDVSGWPLGHKVRIPDTFNFKYVDGQKHIEVLEASMRIYDVQDLEMLPEPPSHADAIDVPGFISSIEGITPVSVGVGPLELLEAIKNKIDAKAYVTYGVVQQDRSTALWRLMCQAFARGGLDRNNVFYLAKHSANNKFKDLRHNADRELAKDVLRAEAFTRSAGVDAKDVIKMLRISGKGFDRRPEILNKVIDLMRERGTFIHTTTDAMWYIRRDSGRPITIASHSELLDTILQMEYGLNLIEPDQNYTVAGLCAYARTVPATGKQESLSYFDADSNSLLIHMGRRDVLRVTADGIDKVVNGANGIVFPWQLSIEPFNYGTPDLDWAEHLFGESAGHDALQNLINLPREAAVAVLRVYMLFLLFRSIAISRPILACLGQPGSGKSTLFRKLYALLYGKNKGVSSVTTQEDFDQNVAADPFVALDGVDSPASWLPDRLSLSASVSDITKRKLYTNSDIIILKRTGLVGITAHNPKFGREDIADRMLLLTFERLHKFIPEQIIIDYVLDHRSSLWGGIIQDAQTVLRTAIPTVDIQFRVEDFARIGTWISRALGCEADFITAVETIRYGQRSFSLEEDAPLIAALKKVVDENEVVDWAPPQLWAKLEWAAADKAAFTKTYRSSTWLGKKLLVLQDALGLAFVTSWKQDPLTNNKIWTIRRREARVSGSGKTSSTSNGTH